MFADGDGSSVKHGAVDEFGEPAPGKADGAKQPGLLIDADWLSDGAAGGMARQKDGAAADRGRLAPGDD